MPAEPSQRPGITHYLYDYSEDMEYLEIVNPADLKTVDMPPAVDRVPPPRASPEEMASPEELTFVVGRRLRPVFVMLDVVRRLRSWTTSSREQRRTTQNQ
jgi:hypothetical protein